MKSDELLIVLYSCDELRTLLINGSLQINFTFSVLKVYILNKKYCLKCTYVKELEILFLKFVVSFTHQLNNDCIN